MYFVSNIDTWKVSLMIVLLLRGFAFAGGILTGGLIIHSLITSEKIRRYVKLDRRIKNCTSAL
jgi:hypothetical protein